MVEQYIYGIEKIKDRIIIAPENIVFKQKIFESRCWKTVNTIGKEIALKGKSPDRGG